MSARAFLWIGAGITVVVAGAVAQVVAEGDIDEPPSKTVVVEFRAPGNSMDATVSWTAPEGTRTYTGQLPLMNTSGTQGVSYEMPRGTPVSITVTNQGGMGSTSLGFAGTVSCHIRVDGRLISNESAKGFHSSVTCSASADW